MTWWQNVINFQSTLVTWAFKLNICFSLSYIFSSLFFFHFQHFFNDWTSVSLFIECEMQLSFKCSRIRLSFISMGFCFRLFFVFWIIFISNELIIAIKPLQVAQKATWFLILFILICIIKCAPYFMTLNVILHSPFQFYSNRTGCLLNAIKNKYVLFTIVNLLTEHYLHFLTRYIEYNIWYFSWFDQVS